MKKMLFCGLLTLLFISCNELTLTTRDYEKAPELIEHCVTLSSEEIVKNMEEKGYSLVSCEDLGSSVEPHCILLFFPTGILKQYPQKGEELINAYYDSGDFFFAISYEITRIIVQGTVTFMGDFDKKMTLYKAYSKWAYKNLPEFSAHEWNGYLNGDSYSEGSVYEGTYDQGGFNEYMQALEDASKKGEEFVDFTFNEAQGPDRMGGCVILPDYEILLQSDECYYTRSFRSR